MTVEFHLLGDVEVRIDGRPVNVGHARQSCVLVALLLERNRPVSPEQLLARVWGEHQPQSARSTLYGYLSRLRRILTAAGGQGVVRHSGGYLIPVDADAVDVHRFRRLVTQARAAADEQSAAELYGQALELWRGDPFASLDTPWLNTVRNALNSERQAAELDRNDLALAMGQHADVVGELAAAADANPLDERLAGQLMLALYRCGRQADAVDRYQRLRIRLADELGIDPGPQLYALYQQILTADPALAAPARSTARTPVRSAQPVDSVPRQLPAPPRSFTGRARELASLTEAIDVPPDLRATVVISAIGGAGGMGKTWLAVRWAHDHVDRFPDGQLYVDLRGFDPTSEPVPPAVAVRGFLDALGVARAAIPFEPDAQAALYRSLVADRRMLVVLDNARDSTQVTPLLPGTPSCAVLVTSRRQLASLISAHGARPLPLDVLADAEARQLLTHHLGAHRVAAESVAVTALLEHCGGLPLALGIVAARAAVQPDLPLATLAGELRAASTRLDALDAGELAVNLRAVLACSYRSLSEDEARVFRLLGLAPGPDLSLAAATSLTALPADRVRLLLRELVGAHLVQEHRSGRYRMHDLVKLYATEQVGAVDPDRTRARGQQRILDHYLHTAYGAATLLNTQRRIELAAPDPDVCVEELADHDQAMAWLTDERLVLLAAVEQAAEDGYGTHAWQLAWAIAEFLDRRGHWHDRVATQRLGLDAATRHGDLIGQAQAHRGLGGAYAVLGRFDEARVELQHALDAFAGLGDPAGQAAAHLDLAGAFERRGEHHAARDHTKQAHDLFELAGHRIGQANALNGLGWLHSELGDQEQALASCERALVLHQQLGHRRGESLTWDSLGYIHHNLSRFDRAVECYGQALKLYRELGERFREAETLDHLGDTQLAAGEPDAARQTWQHSLSILDMLGHASADQVRAKLADTPARPAAQ